MMMTVGVVGVLADAVSCQPSMSANGGRDVLAKDCWVYYYGHPDKG